MEESWSGRPALGDWMDALATFAFCVIAWCCICAVALALFTATSGWQASMRYYEDLLPVVGTLLICLLFLGYYPLLALISGTCSMRRRARTRCSVRSHSCSSPWAVGIRSICKYGDP